MTVEAHFGYLPDPRDMRDHALYRMERERGLKAPTDITRSSSSLGMLELHREVSRMRDQGRTSSCVGQAVAAAVEVRRALDGLSRVVLSALAAYWGARGLYGFAGEDAGSYIRGAMKWAYKVGFPLEDDWPMDDDAYYARPGRTKINRRPTAAAETHGLAMAGGAYERISMGRRVVDDTLDQLQLMSPVVGGFQVTDAFVRAKRGETIPAPASGDRRVGGHAIALLGFDRSGQRILFANSWGKGYGDDGYGWLAAEWLLDPYTGDLWALRANPREAA